MGVLLHGFPHNLQLSFLFGIKSIKKVHFLLWKLIILIRTVLWKKVYLNLREDKIIKIPEINCYFHISRKLATLQKKAECIMQIN